MFKKLLILIFLGSAVSGLYYGAYLPIKKSQAFINIKNAMAAAKTIDEFETMYDKLFQMKSPVGDEEILKFFGYDVATIISSERQSETLSRRLVAYAEPKMLKNNVRHLLIVGGMYEILWRKYKNDADFKKAEEYYLKALEIGPRVPNGLYGLLGLHRDRGDTEKMKMIGQRILKLWPSDEETRRLIGN